MHLPGWPKCYLTKNDAAAVKIIYFCTPFLINLKFIDPSYAESSQIVIEQAIITYIASIAVIGEFSIYIACPPFSQIKYSICIDTNCPGLVYINCIGNKYVIYLFEYLRNNILCSCIYKR
jgi:hypothetical protein